MKIDLMRGQRIFYSPGPLSKTSPQYATIKHTPSSSSTGVIILLDNGKEIIAGINEIRGAE